MDDENNQVRKPQQGEEMTLGKMILFAKKGDRYSVAISDIQDLRLLGSSRIY